MKKRLLIPLLVLFSIFTTGLLSSNRAYASTDSILNKWKYSQLAGCMDSGNFVTSVTPKNSGVTINSIFKNEGTYYLPSFQLAGNKATTKSLKCRQIAAGTSRVSGAVPTAQADITWTNRDLSDYLLIDTFGYEGVAEGEGKINIIANREVNSQYCIDILRSIAFDGFEYCLPTHTANTLASTATITSKTTGGSTTYSISPWGNALNNDFNTSINNNTLTISLKSPKEGTSPSLSSPLDTTADTRTAFNNSKKNFNEAVANLDTGIWQGKCGTLGSIFNGIASFTSFLSFFAANPATTADMSMYCNYTFSLDEKESSFKASPFSEYDFKKTGDDKKAQEVTTINALSGMGIENLDKLLLDDDERYELYAFYLDNAISKNTANRMSCEQSSGMTKVKLKSGGKWVDAYINITDDEKKTAVRLPPTKFDNGYKWTSGKISDVIDWLKKSSHHTSGNTCTNIDAVINPATDANDELKPCFDGMGSLGWIICPVINTLRKALDTLYNEVISPFLQIESGILDRDSVTYKAWATFRDFGNIVFVIVLFLIIFSQITGVGIDNLGIKRMLPKLIVAAILVNMSYIFCQLAVDISNIVGYSVNHLFDGITLNAASGSGIAGDSAAALNAGLVSAAIGAGIGVGAVATAELWLPVMVIPLLLGLISMIMGVLFMFVLLGVRKAAVVVLVVLSPVALVFYMLPNTKKIFDRWLKVFEGVLLVYPICGLLIGGSAFVGMLLWKAGAGSFLSQLLAALITIVPFFMIPSILRGSMSGLGNLGGRISNLGNRFSGGLGRAAAGATRNSAAFKNLQGRSMERMQQREQSRLQGVVDRVNAAERRNGGKVSTQAQLRRARAQQQLSKMQTERLLAEEGAITPMDENIERKQIQSDLTDRRVNAIKSSIMMDPATNFGENVGILEDRLATAMVNGNTEEQRAIAEHLSTKGDSGRSAHISALQKALAQTNGNLSASTLSTYGAIAAGGKFGADYKSNARSQFDIASAINGASDEYDDNNNLVRTKDQVIQDIISSNFERSTDADGNPVYTQSNYGKVEKLDQQRVINSDDREIAQLTSALGNGTMSSADFATAYNSINGALHNERLEASIKPATRAAMEKFVAQAKASSAANPEKYSIPESSGNSNASRKGAAQEGETQRVDHTPMDESGDTIGMFNQSAGGGSGARTSGSSSSSTSSSNPSDNINVNNPINAERVVEAASQRQQSAAQSESSVDYNEADTAMYENIFEQQRESAPSSDTIRVHGQQSAEPAPTPTPTPAPSAEPASTPTPSPTPTPTPTPNPNRQPSSSRSNDFTRVAENVRNRQSNNNPGSNNNPNANN